MLVRDLWVYFMLGAFHLNVNRLADMPLRGHDGAMLGSHCRRPFKVCEHAVNHESAPAVRDQR